MGKEVTHTEFSEEDFSRFREAVTQETALLKSWFDQGRIQGGERIIGFELEAWLLHRPQCCIAPRNQEFLKELDHPLVVPELCNFNIELNGAPQPLQKYAFHQMAEELEQTWGCCAQQAKSMGMDVAIAGTLPTLRRDDMVLENMSPLHRYQVMNKLIFERRDNEPLHFLIKGDEDVLDTFQRNVMMEGTTTSLQIHLQVPFHQTVNAYNAGVLLSAPMVALCANSPFLFGKSLWAETRIPIFEQAIGVDHFDTPKFNTGRVSLGSGFAKESLLELFEENLRDHYIMLPELQSETPEELANLILHNGTIWRWNRPLIDFDDNGEPHLRIEHRPVAAGPTINDIMANIVFFSGVMLALIEHEDVVREIDISFEQAQENFYNAAQYGMDAQVTWKNRTVPVRELLLESLLPLAKEGLQKSEMDRSDWGVWLDIIEGRIRTAQNGSNWQRKWVGKHGKDMDGLMQTYLENQHSGSPVHEWGV